MARNGKRKKKATVASAGSKSSNNNNTSVGGSAGAKNTATTPNLSTSSNNTSTLSSQPAVPPSTLATGFNAAQNGTQFTFTWPPPAPTEFVTQLVKARDSALITGNNRPRKIIPKSRAPIQKVARDNGGHNPAAELKKKIEARKEADDEEEDVGGQAGDQGEGPRVKRTNVGKRIGEQLEKNGILEYADEKEDARSDGGGGQKPVGKEQGSTKAVATSGEGSFATWLRTTKSLDIGYKPWTTTRVARPHTTKKPGEGEKKDVKVHTKEANPAKSAAPVPPPITQKDGGKPKEDVEYRLPSLQEMQKMVDGGIQNEFSTTEPKMKNGISGLSERFIEALEQAKKSSTPADAELSESVQDYMMKDMGLKQGVVKKIAVQYSQAVEKIADMQGKKGLVTNAESIGSSVSFPSAIESFDRGYDDWLRSQKLSFDQSMQNLHSREGAKSEKKQAGPMDGTFTSSGTLDPKVNVTDVAHPPREAIPHRDITFPGITDTIRRKANSGVSISTSTRDTGTSTDDLGGVELSGLGQEMALRTSPVLSSVPEFQTTTAAQVNAVQAMHMVFLGTSCLADLVKLLGFDESGLLSFVDVCKAFAALAADELALYGFEAIDVKYGTLIERCRVKLGGVSLMKFLKEIQFDRDGKTHVSEVARVYRYFAGLEEMDAKLASFVRLTVQDS